MAIETKRASGTITGGHDSTTLTVTMDDSFTLTTNSEVGRIVYLTGNDNAQGRYRRITANTTTTITIDSAFGQSAFRGLTTTLASNSNGDSVNELAATETGQTFAISKTLGECNTTDIIDITDDDGGVSVYRNRNTGISSTAVTGKWYIPSGVVIYDEDIIFQMTYANNNNYSGLCIDLQEGSALILGRQNLGDTSDTEIVGYPSNGCFIYDSSPDLGSAGNQGGDRGALHFNGCKWYGTQDATPADDSGNRGLFYRFLNSGCSFRMWGCEISGRLGARIGGRYSTLYDNRIVANDTRFGPFNPLAVGVFQDNIVQDSFYGLYSLPSDAGNSTVLAMGVQDINGGIIFANINSSADTNTTTQIVNWDFTEMTAATDQGSDLMTVDVNSGAAGDHTYQLRKDYKLDFTNADGTNPTDNANVVFRDTFDSDTTATSDGGSVPSTRLTAYSVVNGNSDNESDIPNLDSSILTKYTDYTWATKYRNHNLLTGTTDLDSPLGPLEQSFPRLVDTSITDTDTSVVDAYTSLDTAAKVYDFADKFKYDNMTMPTLTTQWITRSGTTIETNSDIPIKFDSGMTDVMAMDTDFQIDFGGQDIGVGANAAVNSWGLRSGPDNDDGLVSNQNVWTSWSGNYLHLRAPNGSDDNHFGLFNYLHNASDPVGVDHIDISFTSDGDTGTATFSISDSFTPTTLDSEKTLVVRLGTLVTGTGVGTPPGSGATTAAMRIESSNMRQLLVKSPTTGYTGGVTAPTVEVDTTIQGDITASYIHHGFTDGDTIISSGNISGVMFLPSGTYTISGGDIGDLSIYRQDGETGDVSLIVDSSVTRTSSATLGDNVVFVTSVEVSFSNLAERASIYDITGDTFPTTANIGDARVGASSILVTNLDNNYKISTVSGDDAQETGLGTTITKIAVIGSRAGYDTFYQEYDVSSGDALSIDISCPENSTYNSTADVGEADATLALGTADSEDGKMVVTVSDCALGDAATNKFLLDLRGNTEYRDIMVIDNNNGTELLLPVGLSNVSVDLNRVIFNTVALSQYLTLDTLVNSSDANPFSTTNSASVTSDGVTTSENLTVDRRGNPSGISGDTLSAALGSQTNDISDDLDSRKLTTEDVESISLNIPV